MPTPKQYESRAERQKAYQQRMQQARLQDQEAKGLPPAPALPTMPSEMQGYFDDRSEV